MPAAGLAIGRALVLCASLCLFALVLPSCAKPEPGKEPVARVNGRPISSAELAASLPWQPDSALGEDGTKRRALEDLITKELLVQEAEKQGLEETIAYQLESYQKSLATQALYNAVVADGNRLPEMELQTAYRLLKNESHLQVIDVADESLAQAVETELSKGVPFETLAVRHSREQSAAAGGDLGFLPELALGEPLRSEVMALSPGQWTRPVRVDDGYQIVRLVDRRAAEPEPPPFEELRQRLEYELKREQRRRLAAEYLGELNARLTYNPLGLDILCKPVDSITPGEQEEWVAIKDSAKYVKVSRLLNIARKFPATLDTAMKKYAVKRELQDDLMYEDALKRGLDRLPEVRTQVSNRRRDLLYEALYRKEVADVAAVTDEEARQYYEAHKNDYPGRDFSQAEATVRARLLPGCRDDRFAEYRDSLRGCAQVAVYESTMAKVGFRENPRKRANPDNETKEQ